MVSTMTYDARELLADVSTVFCAAIWRLRESTSPSSQITIILMSGCCKTPDNDGASEQAVYRVLCVAL